MSAEAPCNSDPVPLQMEQFQVYEKYCQNKPRSESLWRQCSDCPFFQVCLLAPLSGDVPLLLDSQTRESGSRLRQRFWWLQECQKKLDHKLSLDSYLLKPVQRITKYQLLLKVRGRAATPGRAAPGAPSPPAPPPSRTPLSGGRPDPSLNPVVSAPSSHLCEALALHTPLWRACCALPVVGRQEHRGRQAGRPCPTGHMRGCLCPAVLGAQQSRSPRPENGCEEL